MKPAESWIKDWKLGVSPAREAVISRDLLQVFQEFWCWAELEEKSKTTQQRYSDALYALGAWAMEEMSEYGSAVDAHQFLVEATSGGDGPLIYLDREEWQREIDTACRKLYKFLVSQC